ncbi:MAG: hypothetical protein SGI71_03280 [Verrucomicrobiota bacterium]|nr:hypothetical protein [Verrucomicrobiota bacterium]
MYHKGIRLSFRHKAWLYSTLAVLYLSGLFWAFLHYFAKRPEGMEELPHPSEPLALQIHGAAAYLVLVILGTLIPIHIKRAWTIRKNVPTGLLVILLNIVLILTGLGLYYFANEALRNFTSQSHLISGLLYLPLLAVHIYLGKKNAL